MSARCPSCGTVYTNDAKFCTKDGTRLVYAPGSAPGAVSPYGPPAQQPAPGGE